jgi:acyl carrier protein
MTDRERYDTIFMETLGLGVNELPGACSGKTKGWDSIGQMGLLAALEDAFGLDFEPEDILTLDSYAAGLALLRAKGAKL